MGCVDYLVSFVELMLLTYLMSFFGLVLVVGFDLIELGSLRVVVVVVFFVVLSVVYGVVMRWVGVLNAVLISGP